MRLTASRARGESMLMNSYSRNLLTDASASPVMGPLFTRGENNATCTPDTHTAAHTYLVWSDSST